MQLPSWHMSAPRRDSTASKGQAVDYSSENEARGEERGEGKDAAGMLLCQNGA